jgi:GntR family histidine utilization transcriptional repressor
MQSHPDQTTFQEVRTEILRRITNGPWCPGTPLPGEVELAEAFGCSRTNMNRALREISDLGFIDRKRKAGTRVRMAPLRQARFEMPLVRAQMRPLAPLTDMFSSRRRSVHRPFTFKSALA